MASKGSVTELFEHYYTALVSSLSMQNTKFLDDLCNHAFLGDWLIIRFQDT